jgi:hypothetical protein
MTDPREREAHEAIGRFWCTFSELECELGETVKVIFKVQDHEAADAIVALADFAKKVNLVRSAVHFARRHSGRVNGKKCSSYPERNSSRERQ